MRWNYDDNFSKGVLLAPIKWTADVASTNGTAVTLDNARDGVALINVGAIDSGSTLTVKIETSSDGTTYTTEVASVNLTASGLYAYALSDIKKYVRLVYSYTAATTVTDGATVGATVLGWNKPDL